MDAFALTLFNTTDDLATAYLLWADQFICVAQDDKHLSAVSSIAEVPSNACNSAHVHTRVVQMKGERP